MLTLYCIMNTHFYTWSKDNWHLTSGFIESCWVATGATVMSASDVRREQVLVGRKRANAMFSNGFVLQEHQKLHSDRTNKIDTGANCKTKTLNTESFGAGFEARVRKKLHHAVVPERPGSQSCFSTRCSEHFLRFDLRFAWQVQEFARVANTLEGRRGSARMPFAWQAQGFR